MNTPTAQRRHAAHRSPKYTFGAYTLLAILPLTMAAIPAQAGSGEKPDRLTACLDKADACCVRFAEGSMNRRVCQMIHYKDCV